MSFKVVGNIINVLSEQLDKKVDKVTGKGLSSNDYTDDDKTKLAGIEDGATKTIVDNALSSASTNPVQNKVIHATLNSITNRLNSIPSKTSDLTNDSGFLTSHQDITGKVDKTSYVTLTVTFDDDTSKNYKFYAEEVTT